ncbi:ACP phosphodiesterase [Amphritea sp. 1_MG-2023]|uniref:acyl carrier protein phosphodiesterase n=1 Tax=Amphritea sp. 1_MG-2023 TaxID=3062670 RepID=UPI0026E324C4|nr:ACP phosphodiesterase [Amphritea sp. 1_MG-2023]MDO6564909.1 ACP phosphodiesterase [Amphritea sp. 1_MG-2023]
MNFFAHLVLAQPTIESRVGNLLGDFARGVDTQTLPAEVFEGLMNHRRVDQFTDQHPQVRRLKGYFSVQRRRFSGIALDVLFDHYLLKHWSQLSGTPVDQVIDALYADLMAGQSLMPNRMQVVTQRLVDTDWFRAYQTLEGVSYALDRIARRIRFRHDFSGVGEELALHYRPFEDGFRLFLTDLCERFPSPLIDAGKR